MTQFSKMNDALNGTRNIHLAIRLIAVERGILFKDLAVHLGMRDGTFRGKLSFEGLSSSSQFLSPEQQVKIRRYFNDAAKEKDTRFNTVQEMVTYAQTKWPEEKWGLKYQVSELTPEEQERLSTYRIAAKIMARETNRSLAAMTVDFLQVSNFTKFLFTGERKGEPQLMANMKRLAEKFGTDPDGMVEQAKLHAEPGEFPDLSRINQNESGTGHTH